MSLFDLSGRVAVVTGGNGGIGLGMARGLATAGARVVVAGRNAEKSAAAAKEIRGDAIEVDVKSEASLKALVADMFETMYAAPGIGLAATQVNVHKRILVCDVGVESKQPYCLINPEILRAEGQTNAEEGCLSVPEYYDFIDRAAVIRVKAYNDNGEPFELDAEGMLAVCIQHEMDHLEGKLFVDYLSELKRERLKKKAVKKAKRAATDTVEARAHKSVPVI